MDGVTPVPAQQRLSVADAGSGDLLAASHLHRYRFAAALCAGRRVLDLCSGVGYGSALLASSAAAVTGVDVAEDAVAEATRHFGDVASFEVGDALSYVERLQPSDFDAVVCFEGIEHVPDAGALADALARLARQGVMLIVSLPNSAAFEERNDFHVTEFDLQAAMTLFGRLGRCDVLVQRLCEGSVIAATPPAASFGSGAAEVLWHDTSAEWAGHWIGVVGVESADVGRASTELAAVVVPNQHRYMRALERSNEELYRANLRLARQHLGQHDAGAGITIGRLERTAAVAEAGAAAAVARIEELEERFEELEERLALEVQVAKNNDDHFQWAKSELERVRRERPRRYRAADTMYGAVNGSAPGRWLWRRLGRG